LEFPASTLGFNQTNELGFGEMWRYLLGEEEFEEVLPVPPHTHVEHVVSVLVGEVDIDETHPFHGFPQVDHRLFVPELVLQGQDQDVVAAVGLDGGVGAVVEDVLDDVQILVLDRPHQRGHVVLEARGETGVWRRRELPVRSG
jgi:hypothetical protein